MFSFGKNSGFVWLVAKWRSKKSAKLIIIHGIFTQKYVLTKFKVILSLRFKIKWQFYNKLFQFQCQNMSFNALWILKKNRDNNMPRPIRNRCGCHVTVTSQSRDLTRFLIDQDRPKAEAEAPMLNIQVYRKIRKNYH